jgi:hypothetical protein
MPNKRVVYGCDNTPNLKEGITLQNIPFFGDDRAQAKKIRRRCVDFVKQKLAKWEPTQGSLICSFALTLNIFCCG